MAARTTTFYMAQTAWIVCLAFVLACLEILLGDLGWILPAAAILGFYVTISVDWRAGGCVACILTVVIEIVLGRRGTMIPVMLLVVAGAQFWKEIGDRSTLLTQVFPGALVGLAYGLPVLVVENIAPGQGGFALSIGHAAVMVVRCSLLSAVALPVFVGVADWLAERLELLPYCKHSFTGADI